MGLGFQASEPDLRVYAELPTPLADAIVWFAVAVGWLLPLPTVAVAVRMEPPTVGGLPRVTGRGNLLSCIWQAWLPWVC